MTLLGILTRLFRRPPVEHPRWCLPTGCTADLHDGEHASQVVMIKPVTPTDGLIVLQLRRSRTGPVSLEFVAEVPDGGRYDRHVLSAAQADDLAGRLLGMALVMAGEDDQ